MNCRPGSNQDNIVNIGHGVTLKIIPGRQRWRGNTGKTFLAECLPSIGMTIKIIYQDEHIIAVDKPQALLSVPGLGPDKKDCMISRLLEIVPQAKVVHRLDCYTSGIMLFAIGIEMQRALSKIFHDRKIQKQYIAVVRQWFEEAQGVIKFPMRCDIENRPTQIVDYEHGKAAITYWQVLRRDEDSVRLLLKPETGRTHQLRVHCKAMGYPIIGDGLYGNDTTVQPRMLLHADNLLFSHPVTGEEMHLFADCEF
jgi:tRNA pseudouridine32 synthase/23S rRNA pseudouridine746 synthase